ncbi:UNVERIFIED_ORG: terminase large subunit [Shinella sp. XGS7]|nr:terminase TerL endonuclease subunit [Shinella sp. XGS7]
MLRHYEDLRTCAARGLYFSPECAWHVISFIERFFVHTKGPLANKPILLDPWQKFWTAVFYGWRRQSDHLRRFSRGYEEVARKNGKSTWKAPQAVYLFMMDGEVGAEVYAVATTREQAMTVFKPAFTNVKRWRRFSPGMARSLRVMEGLNQERIELGNDSSVFRPLPANAENLDGLNPHATIYDELHAAKQRDVWDVMETAMGARLQPVLSAITTAGFVLDGICTDVRNYVISILEGRRKDDSFFGYIYTLDPGDDPLDERNWIKANPGLGRSKTLEYMRGMARKAAALPSALVNFKTKDLNIWCGAPDGWLDMLRWDACGKPFDREMLRGRKCFGGLDLAAIRDLIAFFLIFPPEDPDGDWFVLCEFWCTSETIAEKEKDDAAPYRKWADKGWIRIVPGAVHDYQDVRRAILDAKREYDLAELGFDRWNALEVANDMLAAEVQMVEVPQNTGGMYPGAKLIETLVYAGRLRHGGNPVLRYCIDNTSMLFDSNGNYRPDKRKTRPNGRIDGTVAGCMAGSRALAASPEAQSFWEKS